MEFHEYYDCTSVLQVYCDACGTVDDDGERMMACDVCNVWKHTRCVGIADDQEEPESFVCQDCMSQGQ